MRVRNFCESLEADSAPVASGVYVILNTAARRFYIGKSINIAARIAQHKTELRMARHSNKALQADWIEHGPAHFVFAPFALSDAESIGRLEQELIAESINDDCYNWMVTPPSERGQGRKPISPTGELMRSRPVRMTDAEWETCKALGGAAWIRENINSASLD